METIVNIRGNSLSVPYYFESAQGFADGYRQVDFQKGRDQSMKHYPVIIHKNARQGAARGEIGWPRIYGEAHERRTE